MNAVVRRLAIGACLVVSGLAVTVRQASAQVTDQLVAPEQASVNFDLPAATPNLSWIAPKATPKVRFNEAAMAPRQSTDSGIGFGALVGFVRTSATGDTDDIDFVLDPGQGWMAGIWFGGNRDGVLGFMGEVSYVVKNIQPTEDDTAVKIGYIEIPAVFRINIGQRSKNGVSVYGIAGPVFDFKINDNADDFDLDDDAFEQFQIGILAGAGVEVARFAFEVRGNWGLREVISTDITENAKIKTFTLQVLGKFRFN